MIQKPELGRPFPVRAHDHFVSEDNHSANGKLVNVKALPGAQRPATSTGATSQGAEAPRKDVFFQPDWACPKPRDRFGEVWSLRIARGCAFADSEQLGRFG